MSDDWKAVLDDVFRGWHDGHIAHYEIGNGIDAILDDTNVDAICQALPEWYRSEFEEHLCELARARPEDMFMIFGGIRHETESERREREAAERAEFERICAVARGWHERNRRGRPST